MNGGEGTTAEEILDFVGIESRVMLDLVTPLGFREVPLAGKQEAAAAAVTETLAIATMVVEMVGAAVVMFGVAGGEEAIAQERIAKGVGEVLGPVGLASIEAIDPPPEANRPL